MSDFYYCFAVSQPVALGLTHLKKKTLKEVREILDSNLSSISFYPNVQTAYDYVCATEKQNLSTTFSRVIAGIKIPAAVLPSLN